MTLKSLHVLGAILLLGNIIVTAWWKALANRTRNPGIIAFAQRQVTLTDFVFTLPGAVLLVATGDYVSYATMENSWSVTWNAWGRGLFMASGLVWLTILVPAQIRQARMARAFAAAVKFPPNTGASTGAGLLSALWRSRCPWVVSSGWSSSRFEGTQGPLGRSTGRIVVRPAHGAGAVSGRRNRVGLRDRF